MEEHKRDDYVNNAAHDSAVFDNKLSRIGTDYLALTRLQQKKGKAPQTESVSINWFTKILCK